MERLILRSQAIGSSANDALQAARQGKAVGQTSGGVFLHTDNDQILFLSLDSWRGPLTINLSVAARKYFSIDLHSPFLVQAQSIDFPVERITILFDQGVRWAPPPRPAQELPWAERQTCFAHVSAVVTAALADRLEPARDAISNLEAVIDPGSAEVSLLRIAVDSRRPGKVIEALVAGLGSGPGLTPAGDDLALGFLLALNRWGDRLCPELPPGRINMTLVEAARQRTTALGANLIRCAAAGLADERLVSALDGLISGNLAEDHIVERLLGWGHTSGCAAMLGLGVLLG